MKIAYFDCFSGISGNMIIGAFLDAGLNLDDLKKELEKIDLTGYNISCSRVEKNSIAGTYFEVKTNEKQPLRNLDDIIDLINRSRLNRTVKDNAIKVFTKIAEAEGRIHGKEISEVHFHEVGAVDSIIDIVSAFIAIDILCIEKIYSSRIHLGNGFTESMHGTIPVPSPATSQLLKDVPVYSTGIGFELTTPTGAAIISHIAENFGNLPDMNITATGYGAGKRDLTIPNLLRIITGNSIETPYDTDTVEVIDTNIDDMNPEILGYLLEKLLSVGALDAYYTPVYMKKSRPGILLTVISEPANSGRIADIIFSETTTSGIRTGRYTRKKLKREIIQVDCLNRKIAVKLHYRNGKLITITPEYEDCKSAAESLEIPLKNVYDAALSAAKLITDEK